MSDVTASYKMTHGLAPALMDPLLKELREAKLSLNIDEATSKTQERVLAVLVSHFSPSQKKVLFFELTKVSAETIFEGLKTIFTKHEIPWENLVSVLMDSCKVMRGEKNGLEALIRKRKAPQLLDIDGDSCHHAQNACKEFC